MEEKPKSIKEWAEEYFDKMYEYAKIYYEHNGNLYIDKNFTTDDGFTYNPNGQIRLGHWVHNQIKRALPDTPHGQRLAQIGMIWDYNANKRAVYELCRKYIIDTEINYLLVNRLTAQEFEAKINYLLANEMPLMNNKRELHEVFYLSNEELEKKYGITKEQIYQQYYNTNDNALTFTRNHY